jgi:translation elongation factor EF-Ts
MSLLKPVPMITAEMVKEHRVNTGMGLMEAKSDLLAKRAAKLKENALEAVDLLRVIDDQELYKETVLDVLKYLIRK